MENRLVIPRDGREVGKEKDGQNGGRESKGTKLPLIK